MGRGSTAISLRLALPGDAPSIARILRACQEAMPFLPRLHTPEEDLRYVGESMLPGLEVWVAEEGGRVLGFVALTEATLGHLYVEAGAQGRGIGRTLFARARERRPAGFELWVFQENDGARRFYEREGCRLVRLTDGRDNEEQVPDALYAWRPDRDGA